MKIAFWGEMLIKEKSQNLAKGHNTRLLAVLAALAVLAVLADPPLLGYEVGKIELEVIDGTTL